MTRRFDPLHTSLPLARRPLRVLAAVVERATLAMFHPGQALALGRAIALQLICNDRARDIPQALEQLAKELLGRVLVAATLHEDIEHVIILIHGAPQVMALPVNRHKHLVEVPLVPRLGASTLQWSFCHGLGRRVNNLTKPIAIHDRRGSAGIAVKLYGIFTRLLQHLYNFPPGICHTSSIVL